METQLGVCMIISSFHPKIGGAERQAQRLAARLIEKGGGVHVLTRRYKGLKDYDEIEGIPVHRVPIVGTGILAAFSYILSAIIWLSRNHHRFQILHCHIPLSPATIGVISKLLWKKKVIVTIAGRGVEEMPFGRVRCRLLRLVDLFIVLNEESKTRLVEAGLGNVPMRKLPYGVNTRRFHPVPPETKLSLRAKLGIPQNKRIVIFVGRLHPVKGLDILLKAWHKLSHFSGCAQLLLVGDGPENAYLKELTAQLQIENTVSFLGSKYGINEYMQACDIFVLPSFSEGLSNSLLEAMSSGLAIVATNVEGSSEAIKQGHNGLLVEPRDIDQLAQALKKMIDKEELSLKLARQARQTATTKYSLESAVENRIQVYRELSIGALSDVQVSEDRSI